MHWQDSTVTVTQLMMEWYIGRVIQQEYGCGAGDHNEGEGAVVDSSALHSLTAKWAPTDTAPGKGKQQWGSMTSSPAEWQSKSVLAVGPGVRVFAS